jgi:peptidoglycan hydrolase-like amidase
MMRTAMVLLAAALPAQGADVRIQVLGLFHPKRVEVIHTNSAAGDFVLRIPGRFERRYRGSAAIERDGDVMVPVVTMDVETAVASIVAAESPPGAAMEALKAQAIVARSYLLASRPRHRHADFCDTTHCQLLRDPPEEGSEFAEAARATAGMVLTYDRKIVQALYSADCGGHTRALAPGQFGPSRYPYFAVVCDFRSGAASGHRVGLCQRGAAAMARNGIRWRDILRHYFPATTIALQR